MNFTIEHEREEDGRWLAEVPEIPGALAYGATASEAMAKVEALALRVLAETPPIPINTYIMVRRVQFSAPWISPSMRLT